MYAQNYNPLNLSSIHKAMCVEEIGETYDPLFQLDNDCYATYYNASRCPESSQ